MEAYCFNCFDLKAIAFFSEPVTDHYKNFIMLCQQAAAAAVAPGRLWQVQTNVGEVLRVNVTVDLDGDVCTKGVQVGPILYSVCFVIVLLLFPYTYATQCSAVLLSLVLTLVYCIFHSLICNI